MARTSAAGAVPKVSTRAAVRSAIAATSGSSAFSTATPSAGSASTSSPFALATTSFEPNSPMCALPTFSTTPIRGRAIWQSWAMWPTPRAEFSSTRYRVPAVARSTVYGWPSSLLNDPGGATVGPSRDRSWASRSLVEVFPEEPVTPTTTRPGSRSSTACASSASAASTSGTTTAGTQTGRAASTAAAPAATAAAA